MKTVTSILTMSPSSKGLVCNMHQNQHFFSTHFTAGHSKAQAKRYFRGSPQVWDAVTHHIVHRGADRLWKSPAIFENKKSPEIFANYKIGMKVMKRERDDMARPVLLVV